MNNIPFLNKTFFSMPHDKNKQTKRKKIAFPSHYENMTLKLTLKKQQQKQNPKKPNRVIVIIKTFLSNKNW